MAISNDLFLAILAMDSYNRVYNQGLKLDETVRQIGNAQIGIATNPDTDLAAVAASFFAQAYTLNNGQTVISYRGTDSDPNSNGDYLQGWPLGAGLDSAALVTLQAASQNPSA